MATIPDSVARRGILWGSGNRTWLWLLLALALALTGFWKTYFSRIHAADAATHLHAGLMLAWFALLFLQPWLVRTRRLSLHRQVGKVSYLLVPAILLTCLWLSKLRMSAATPQSFGFQSYLLYLALSAGVMLTLFWALAIRHRRNTGLHARYMVGTVLVLVDPALVRLLLALLPPMNINYQWITYGVVFAILAVLIWRERQTTNARSAFRVMAAAFMINLVLIHVVPGSDAWATFARGWGGLPAS